jgi:CBS domain containing-hemolysin-like protein
MPFQRAKFAAIPLLLMQKAFAPVEWLAARLKKRRTAEPHGERARGVLLPDELKEMLSMSGFASDVDARLRGLLKEIIDFSEVEVHEVMVPRVDMVSCRADAPLDELIEIIKKKKIKHVPVYGANRDEILGTVNAKEVFAGRANDVRSLIKPVMFVPETKKVESLLADFRQEKQTFAVVVNEYGGTEGIVTLEDVVEEIVGEIEDEFDRVRPRITRLSARKWLVDAGYSLRDFCERFGLSADQGLADTVGGFVAALLGEVPLVGAEVRYGPLKMTLREVRKYRPVVILVEVMKEMEE